MSRPINSGWATTRGYAHREQLACHPRKRERAMDPVAALPGRPYRAVALHALAAYLAIALVASSLSAQAADLELSETLSLPECHAIGWVRLNTQPKEGKEWNGELDEAIWGTPSNKQPVLQNWDWKLDDSQWREAVSKLGEGKREDCTFDLWMPEGIEVVKGVVVMSGHGSGAALFKNEDLRNIARELHLALFTFIGNPVQRGFWPKSLLYERLEAFGERSGHPELEHAPLFLYGHSNGTGFSAIFPATEAARVWGWISMRPGITFQVYQPGAAKVPGMVIFGEDDHFLGRPSKEANLAIVPAMRKRHDALWNFAVEPKTGHGPGANTWPLVFSFLRHTWAARVPADADPRRGPVTLAEIQTSQGHLGHNWKLDHGGYQTLSVAPFAEFTGDKSTASWLVNESFARDWQTFQAKGSIP
jgi:hypothetical protein